MELTRCPKSVWRYIKSASIAYIYWHLSDLLTSLLRTLLVLLSLSMLLMFLVVIFFCTKLKMKVDLFEMQMFSYQPVSCF